VDLSSWRMERVYTVIMGLARYRTNVRAGFESAASSDTFKVEPWGIYGEAIGNPKFYIGTNPKDSEFLQADTEFAAAHEDLLRELAKH
jgi:hypothetical protein